MRGQHPPRRADGTRKGEDEISRLTAVGRAAMRRVGLNRRRRGPCAKQFAADELGHFAFFAAAAWDRHQLQNEFQRTPQVGFPGPVRFG